MGKREILSRMLSERLIPVVRVSSANEAIEVAGAIKEGGASFLEITMTVPGGIEVIKALGAKFRDEIIIGAGTVLDTETGRTALLAGAQFLVSPTWSPELIRLALRYDAVVIPGAMTPTEILAAWESGADLVKVFPAGQIGGAEFLKAIKGPFPQIRLMPSGGVNLKNVAGFLKAGASVVAVGGELVDKAAVEVKKFEVITKNTRAFLKAIQEAGRG